MKMKKIITILLTAMYLFSNAQDNTYRVPANSTLFLGEGVVVQKGKELEYRQNNPIIRKDTIAPNSSSITYHLYSQEKTSDVMANQNIDSRIGFKNIFAKVNANYNYDNQSTSNTRTINIFCELHIKYPAATFAHNGIHVDNSVDTQNFYKQYGTHYISEIYRYSSLVVIIKVHNVDESNISSLNTGISGNYSSTFSVNAGINYTKVLNEKSNSGDIEINITGDGLEKNFKEALNSSSNQTALMNIFKGNEPIMHTLHYLGNLSSHIQESDAAAYMITVTDWSVLFPKLNAKGTTREIEPSTIDAFINEYRASNNYLSKLNEITNEDNLNNCPTLRNLFSKYRDSITMLKNKLLNYQEAISNSFDGCYNGNCRIPLRGNYFSADEKSFDKYNVPFIIRVDSKKVNIDYYGTLQGSNIQTLKYEKVFNEVVNKIRIDAIKFDVHFDIITPNCPENPNNKLFIQQKGSSEKYLVELETLPGHGRISQGQWHNYIKPKNPLYLKKGDKLFYEFDMPPCPRSIISGAEFVEVTFTDYKYEIDCKKINMNSFNK
jgi:hypothetical protein